MTLYGLDILIDTEGKKFIAEISGAPVGMNGFEEIYGDQRVKGKVYDMLEEKYGAIAVNDGSYSINEYKKTNPIRSRWINLICYFSKKGWVDLTPSVLRSEKAEVEWIKQEIPNGKIADFPFETYSGQESVVLNLINQELPHPLVNNYVAEEITRNKFFQYQLLKDSDISEHLPESSLVGLGWADKEELENLMEDNNFFIVKPIFGAQGRGVRVINSNEISKYQGREGPLRIVKPKERLATHFHPKVSLLEYVEDYVPAGNFSFEPGMAIIQPFIRSTMNVNGEELYSSIRSIVCNGKFVDAYARVSPDPIANLSQSALAQPYHDPEIAEFSEKVIATLEQVCANYKPDSFKEEIYSDYFSGRERGKFFFLSSFTRAIMDIKEIK